MFSGDVNPKNNIFWGSRFPEHYLQIHSLKCTALVAISKHSIIGPFWFEDDNEHNVTIYTDRYVHVLHKFWTALGWQKVVVRVCHVQQYGTTPHTSKESIGLLKQRFSDWLISRKCDPQWSLYSPDLNPPDFYLWGYLKDWVYAHNCQCITDLETEITATIKAISREKCEKVIENFARRI